MQTNSDLNGTEPELLSLVNTCVYRIQFLVKICLIELICVRIIEPSNRLIILQGSHIFHDE